MSIAFARARSGGRPFVGLVVDSLRGITLRQLRGAMLFGLGISAFTLLTEMNSVIIFARTVPLHLLISRNLLDFQVRAFCLLLALVIADCAVDEGARKRTAYIAAALGGCIAGVLLSITLFDWAWRTLVWPEQWPPPTRPWIRAGTLYYNPIYNLASWLLIGGSAAFLYADRRAARKTETHLHAAELDRIRRSKIALESRLQAMQARVEPQFLFNTLAQVEHLYEIDPALAGRMLDDLIAYLRAAMPKMRDTSSTLAQEVELVRAYLAIVKVRLGDRLTYEIDVPADARDVRMPPMMLLPLADHAVVHGLEHRQAYGTIRIACEIAGGSLRLTIVDRGAGFVPEPTAAGIASIRERLAVLYRGAASLELHAREAGGTEAIMEIPCEWVKRASNDDGTLFPDVRA